MPARRPASRGAARRHPLRSGAHASRDARAPSRTGYTLRHRAAPFYWRICFHRIKTNRLNLQSIKTKRLRRNAPFIHLHSYLFAYFLHL
ncbi:hypothetical protein BURPS1710A_A0291 [Burkholderia pseudomallei 1710a]|uniref:Uncharacterized protein n=1 Tax=Burkholderia pseudomallei 1710a TaxID=320371 RepID=A0A0E1VTM2_BURPE|nr:hypothetical protein BUC_5377 [Burkholderia pseudomallei 576]EET04285.1 hypothetical protein BURPS1710A_A0291 [Burkholderia pseudomallei 1710a]